MFLETRRFQKYILFYAYFQYFSIYKTFSYKNHRKVNKFFMGTNFQFRGLHEFLKTIQTEIKHSNISNHVSCLLFTRIINTVKYAANYDISIITTD